jgi:hypothetical protein
MWVQSNWIARAERRCGIEFLHCVVTPSGLSVHVRNKQKSVIRNELKTNHKNRDGWIRVRFPPPVQQFGKFSPPRRAPEKQVISKALTE